MQTCSITNVCASRLSGKNSLHVRPASVHMAATFSGPWWQIKDTQNELILVREQTICFLNDKLAAIGVSRTISLQKSFRISATSLPALPRGKRGFVISLNTMTKEIVNCISYQKHIPAVYRHSVHVTDNTGNIRNMRVPSFFILTFMFSHSKQNISSVKPDETVADCSNPTHLKRCPMEMPPWWSIGVKSSAR